MGFRNRAQEVLKKRNLGKVLRVGLNTCGEHAENNRDFLLIFVKYPFKSLLQKIVGKSVLLLHFFVGKSVVRVHFFVGIYVDV